ncbi:hypothetical protein Pan216_09320 [Planctomycetes bacterium Pan216]|uniref:DUF3616 domain-containing protein n=1 Tax=Kolteria novifilia TaxID=2527975 RepID=A0A518AZE4_9BACT|nr:hypothetical protein Pan216_09320 [Planctomycetes bacterium Pan216]
MEFFGSLLVLVGSQATVLAAEAPANRSTIVVGHRSYSGTCDASAAFPLTSNQFLVASDEDNILRLYGTMGPTEPIAEFDLSEMLSLDDEEADIEAVACVGNRSYWITSHGRDGRGRRCPSRLLFFATEVSLTTKGKPRLDLVGKPSTILLQELLADPRYARFNLFDACQKPPKAPGGLNIEGLCATPEGDLLIGLRNPLRLGRALVVPLENPAKVVEGGKPRFGNPIGLNLGGLGIRGLEYWPERDCYLIIAGPPQAGGEFNIYAWSHNETTEELRVINGLKIGQLQPEAILTYPGDPFSFQILSDDGTHPVDDCVCKDHPKRSARKFRSAWVVPASTAFSMAE